MLTCSAITAGADWGWVGGGTGASAPPPPALGPMHRDCGVSLLSIGFVIIYSCDHPVF